MTTQENYKDEWLDRAFRLAFFLHGERETAKKIALAAMNKLETASTAQFKRLYYTPTGRSTSKAVRSRVSLGDLQLLQRLVLVESEVYERRREEEGNVCERSLLTFFIKHLVRISLKRNSFYVTLAIARILHNYPTADAMEIYNVVVQDPERVHDDYYYRSRKGVLMKELKARFGDLLEVVKANRGEERFSSSTTNGRELVETANKCLVTLTPWNSSCAIPEKFDPFTDLIKSFHFDKNDPDEEHRTELNRIHAALHPDCFGRLTQALDLSSPRDAMEVPKFMITENQANTNNDHWNDPPSLDQDELKQIKALLSAQAASRRAATAGFLRVIADGSQIGLIDAASSAPRKFELGDEVELIEVYAEDGTLLATHILNFGDLRNGRLSQAITLEGGQKLSFSADPTLDDFGEVSKVGLSINYEETSWQKRFAATLNSVLSFPMLKSALSLGALLLAIAIGWLLLRDSEPVLVVDREIKQVDGVNALPPSVPDNNEQFVANGRNENEVKEPIEEAPRQPDTANASRPKSESRKERSPKLESPVPPSQQMANRSPAVRNEIDEDGILRLPMRDRNQRLPEDLRRNEAVRSYRRPIDGKSLSEIRSLYLETSGDHVLGKQVAEKLANSLSQIINLSVTSDKELADAALKLYVRHESDVDDPDEKTVTVIVRLVNAKGYVVYPNRKGVSGWKYVGTINKLPGRIASDLIKTRK